MEKRSEKEYFLAFTVIVVLALLLTGFYFAWITKQSHAPVAYEKFSDIVVTNETYSIKTDIAIQVASENEEWLRKHKAPIESILRNSLADADPQLATGPDGLFALQKSLKSASNRAFKTNRIQNVFFTNFVLVQNGSQ